jgi:signal transduction histidine kinase
VLVQRLTQSVNGTLHIKSDGGGTTITISLPARPAKPEGEAGRTA